MGMELLGEQLGEETTPPPRSLAETTGLVLIVVQRLAAAQENGQEYDPEEVLEHLLRLAAICLRCADHVLLPEMERETISTPEEARQ